MLLLLFALAFAPQETVVAPIPPPAIITRTKDDIRTARYEQDFYQDTLDSL